MGPTWPNHAHSPGIPRRLQLHRWVIESHKRTEGASQAELSQSPWNALHGQGVAHDSQMIGLDIALGEVTSPESLLRSWQRFSLALFPFGLASLFCGEVGRRSGQDTFQERVHGLQYFRKQGSGCLGIKIDSMIKRFHLIAAKKTPADGSILWSHA